MFAQGGQAALLGLHAATTLTHGPPSAQPSPACVCCSVFAHIDTLAFASSPQNPTLWLWDKTKGLG